MTIEEVKAKMADLALKRIAICAEQVAIRRVCPHEWVRGSTSITVAPIGKTQVSMRGLA